jgi:holo-[acyl-carrier protein] synthase
MIVGTGIDIAEVLRIRHSIERFGDRFLQRIYTEGEIRYCDSKANRFERYAARFAAKEAAMKALGVGLGAFGFHDVEVVREPSGAPSLALTGGAAALAASLGVTGFRISITHTDRTAEAVVAALS